jgi:hypothetical protein
VCIWHESLLNDGVVPAPPDEARHYRKTRLQARRNALLGRRLRGVRRSTSLWQHDCESTIGHVTKPLFDLLTTLPGAQNKSGATPVVAPPNG